MTDRHEQSVAADDRTGPDFPAYLDRIRDLVRGTLIPNEHRLEGEDRMPADLAASLREAGLFGISVPRAYGGLGLTMEEQVLVMFEVTRASASYRAHFSTTIGLGTQPILHHGTEAQRRDLLPRLASGRMLAAFALTEPDFGSDAGSIATRAVRDGDGYVLNGTKRYITNASEAGVFVVMARTDPAAKGAAGISAFIVPRETPGLSVGAIDRKMGQDAAPTSEVYFEDCRVPHGALIGGREGQGFKTAMHGINHARLHVAVACSGQADRLLQESVDYASQRVQFGVPIIEHQAIQIMLADSRAETLAARSMILETARRVDREGVSPDAIGDIACCKLFASEMVTRVADRAMQIHGGAGYMKTSPIQRLYRDVRLFRIFEGTSQIQQTVIARDLMRRHAAHSRPL
jgi:acyl-CoA dehydrogenase